MLNRRPVGRSKEFLDKAHALFPVGGSVDGTPSWQTFSENVLIAAEIALGRDFERYDLGDGIAVFTTAETAFFRRPLAFYARLTDAGQRVELIDVEVDESWTDFDLPETD
ncbi:MAG: hypothetical protein ACXVKA_06700 [Acidimicrobiia bacterium]